MAWHSLLARLRRAAGIQTRKRTPERFFALSLDMLCTTALDGRFLQVNPAFTKILGHSEPDLLSRNILDLMHPDDYESTALRLSGLARGNAVDTLENRWRCADGSYIWVAWTSVPYPDEGLLYSVAHDRTRQRLAEEALRQADARCVCALESTTDAFFAVDSAWRLIRVNQQAEQLWRRDRMDLLGRSLWEVFPEAGGGPFHRLYEEVMRTAKPVHAEEFYPHPANNQWFEIHAYPSAEGLAVYFRDVTEHRQSEEKIKRSLREKEVLLREIHHRVKNNLQIVCSMLRLQARNIQDETLLQALRDCRERVQAMAMLHDQLHRSRDLSNINLGEYIRNLAASLFCSYGVNSAEVGLRMDIEDIAVSIDTAIPCGLIVNELVSNSLRHAFPEGRRGQICLGLAATSGGNAELTVADDGRGIPETAHPAPASSLGLRLVDLLAEQIDATMERSSAVDRGMEDADIRTGTAYRLVFQATKSKEIEADEQTPHPVGRG